jgi:ankyrin repeat protein
MCRPPRSFLWSVDADSPFNFETGILFLALICTALSLLYGSLGILSSVFSISEKKYPLGASSDEQLLTEEHLEPIALRQWKTVLSWIAFHPDQVGRLRDTTGQTVLHHASLFRAPVVVIESILWAAPELASVPNREGEVPLHWAVRLSSPSPVLNVLLETDPETAFMVDYMDSTPLAMLWERHQTALIETFRYDKAAFFKESNNSWKRVISIFQAVSNAQNLQNTETFFPLHIAASRCTPPSLFPFMMQVYKDQLSSEDLHGRTPLSIACQSPAANRSFDILTKIQFLLKEDPSQAKHPDSKSGGRLPLHLALGSGICWNDGIESLIMEYPSALSERDPLSGLYPFALAAIQDHTKSAKVNAKDTSDHHLLTTVYNLLREEPSLVNLEGLSSLP